MTVCPSHRVTQPFWDPPGVLQLQDLELSFLTQLQPLPPRAGHRRGAESRGTAAWAAVGRGRCARCRVSADGAKTCFSGVCLKNHETGASGADLVTLILLFFGEESKRCSRSGRGLFQNMHHSPLGLETAHRGPLDQHGISGTW